MAGIINWRKVSPPGSNPDTNHLYVGVDPSDCKLYIKDDTGLVTKYETTANVAAAISAALSNYDLSTIVDSKISNAVNNLISGAPAALDTLNELAAALADDANFATTITNSLALKYDASNPAGYQTAAQVNTTTSNAIAAHNAAADPHPQYLTTTEGNSAYQPLDGDLTAVAALTGAGFAVRTTTNTWATRSLTTPVGSGLAITNQDGVFGSPAFTNTDKGSTAVSTHEGLSDPHPQYETSAEAQAKVDAHATLTNNPHATTKAQVGLGSVDNTSDLAKPISTATQTALNGKADLTGGNTFTGTQVVETLGIGTSTPVGALEIYSAVNAGNFINISTPGTQNAQQVGFQLVTKSDNANLGTATNKGWQWAARGDAWVAESNLSFVAFWNGSGWVQPLNLTQTGQVGVGVSLPSASAKFQVDSTTQGFLMPRMTSAQRDAIGTPAQGLQVFDTDLDTVCTFDGSVWIFEIYKVVQNNQATTSNVYANITELVTPALPIGRYFFEFYGACQSTLTTTGVGIRLGANGATIGALNATWSLAQAANGTDKDFEYSQLSATTDVSSTGVLTANADFPVLGSGVFSLSVAGSVSAQIRSEVGLSGVSVRINSVLRIRRVTG